MERRILAMGGGGFSMEPDNPRLDDFVLSLARSSRPRVCFMPTASGDSERYLANFYRAFSGLPASDLLLFDRGIADIEAFVLEQDVIDVGGGNTASVLAVWRAHGLDAVLRRVTRTARSSRRCISGTELAEVVASRPEAAAYRVTPDGEERVPPRRLD